MATTPATMATGLAMTLAAAPVKATGLAEVVPEAAVLAFPLVVAEAEAAAAVALTVTAVVPHSDGAWTWPSPIWVTMQLAGTEAAELLADETETGAAVVTGATVVLTEEEEEAATGAAVEALTEEEETTTGATVEVLTVVTGVVATALVWAEVAVVTGAGAADVLMMVLLTVELTMTAVEHEAGAWTWPSPI